MIRNLDWRSIFSKLVNTLVALALFISAGLVAVIVYSGYFWGQEWVGVGEMTRPIPKEDAQMEIVPAKTFWDWLDLIVVPAMLAIIGYFLNQAGKANEKRATKKAAQVQRELAQKRNEDAILRAYLDTMTGLIMSGRLIENEEDQSSHRVKHERKRQEQLKSVVALRTRVALRQLDPPRKATIIQFLSDAKLITSKELGSEAYLSLDNADLQGVDLSGLRLFGANFTGANLDGAVFHGSDIRAAVFNGADLSNADLSQVEQADTDISKQLRSATKNKTKLPTELPPLTRTIKKKLQRGSTTDEHKTDE